MSKVKVVPTIVVNNNRALSGRDAFAWLQNEMKNVISGVESFGTSSAYTYIEEERSEYSISSPYVSIDQSPVASPERHTMDEGKSLGDLETAMDRLKAERSQVTS